MSTQTASGVRLPTIHLGRNGKRWAHCANCQSVVSPLIRWCRRCGALVDPEAPVSVALNRRQS